MALDPFTAVIDLVTGIGTQVAKNIFPDPEDELKRLTLENELKTQVLANANALQLASAENIKTEAASAHWLAANWRPITMLVFVGLVVARWFGWTAPNMTEAEYLSIYELIKIGLGGYVAARTAEKVLPDIITAIKKK